MEDGCKRLRDEGADILVAFMHAGAEKTYIPTKRQMALAHAAVKGGADVVVGTHPHVLQPIEVYQGSVILYSIGNFCFGGNKNPSDKDCMIVQQTFTVRGNDVTIDNTNVIPCSISSVSSRNNYQPTPATGDEKERIEAKIKRSSDAIAEMAAS